MLAFVIRLLFVGLLLVSIQSIKPTNAIADELTVSGLCESILDPSPEKTSPGQLSWSDLLNYVFHRDESVSVGFYDHSLQAQKYPGKRQVLIFSLGGKAELDGEAQAILNDAYWAAVKLNRDIRALKKERSLDACISMAPQYGVTDETLNRTSKLIDTAKQIRHRQVNSLSFEMAQKTLDIYERAQLIPAKSFEDIRPYFQTPYNEANGIDLVLILHGATNGLLLDSSQRIVPRSFFKEIRPDSNINSVTIYSCYPEQVAKFYGSALDSLVASGIQVFFPINQFDLAGVGGLSGNDTTPLNSLEVFAKKHAAILQK